jgi:hypothetical protein
MRFATLVVAAWFAAVGLAPQAQAHPGHSECREDHSTSSCEHI